MAGSKIFTGSKIMAGSKYSQVPKYSQVSQVSQDSDVQSLFVLRGYKNTISCEGERMLSTPLVFIFLLMNVPSNDNRSSPDRQILSHSPSNLVSPINMIRQPFFLVSPPLYLQIQFIILKKEKHLLINLKQRIWETTQSLKLCG